MRTVAVGKFCFDRNGCYFLDRDSRRKPIEPPFRQFFPLERMDQKMALFCEGKKCFYFTDRKGLIFCGEEDAGSGADPEFMSIVSKLYSHEIKKDF